MDKITRKNNYNKKHTNEVKMLHSIFYGRLIRFIMGKCKLLIQSELDLMGDYMQDYKNIGLGKIFWASYKSLFFEFKLSFGFGEKHFYSQLSKIRLIIR
jgi:hypothetical protein